MDGEKKAHILRLLVFWLGGGKIDDPEYVLNSIAAEAGVTRDEVWQVYDELVRSALGV